MTEDALLPPAQPPPHIRVLANGAWYDNNLHHIVSGGGVPTTGITSSARAHELNAKRREMVALKSRKEIARRATEAKNDGLQYAPTDAVGYLAGEAYASSLANMMDKPREAVDAGKFALRLADMQPADEKVGGPVAAVQIVLSPEAAAQTDSFLMPGRVIDAKVVEIGSE
jgi:hypothetical protein